MLFRVDRCDFQRILGLACFLFSADDKKPGYAIAFVAKFSVMLFNIFLLRNRLFEIRDVETVVDEESHVV